MVEIGTQAFQHTNLKELNLPDSVIKIGDMAFYLNANLTQVRFSENLQTIGEAAFSACNNLVNINIPASVIEIDGSGNGLFSGEFTENKEIIIHEAAMESILGDYKNVTPNDSDTKQKVVADKIKKTLGIFKCNAVIHYDGSNFDILKELVKSTNKYTYTWINDAG